METIKTLSKEIFETLKQDKKKVQRIAYAHGVADKNWNLQYKKASFYPIAYIVTDEQIKEAKEILENFKKEELEEVKKEPQTIFFVNMGMDFVPKEDEKQKYIWNHRVRAFFKNKYNILCFAEFGTMGNMEFIRCDFAIHSYNEKDTTKNIYNHKWLEKISKNQEIEYTEENIIQIINENFNASFDKIKFYDIISSEEIKAVL